jgi:hypothetical protein
MYGLTASFNAAMFMRLEIESITYAENAIHVSLSDGFAITSMTGIRYRGKSRSCHTSSAAGSTSAAGIIRPHDCWLADARDSEPVNEGDSGAVTPRRARVSLTHKHSARQTLAE